MAHSIVTKFTAIVATSPKATALTLWLLIKLHRLLHSQPFNRVVLKRGRILTPMNQRKHKGTGLSSTATKSTPGNRSHFGLVAQTANAAAKYLLSHIFFQGVGASNYLGRKESRSTLLLCPSPTSLGRGI